MSTTLADLRKLSEIITQSIDQIEKEVTASNLEFPSAESTYTKQSEAARELPEVFEASNRIVAAAGQLAALVRSPPLTILDTAFKVPS